MPEINQQDMVWIRFPFSDLQKTKFRPGLVLSNNPYNKGQDIVVCVITSKLDQKEYDILIDASNLSDGKLPLKSKIRSDKVMGVEKNLVEKSFARLNDKTFDSVVSKIEKLIKRKSSASPYSEAK